MYVDFLENIDIGINYIDYNWKDDGALNRSHRLQFSASYYCSYRQYYLCFTRVQNLLNER